MLVALRVVIADDSLLVREGLEQLLADQPNIEVVAACADLTSLLEAIERDPPDVVLTDIRMPPSSSDEGIRVGSAAAGEPPAVGVVVLSQYSEPAYALALLESGSDGRGYLLKERVHDRAQLLSAIETVAHGGSVIDPKIVDVLVAAKARAERSPLVGAHAARARGARRDRPGQEQQRDRRLARAHEASRREAHQLDLLEARSRRRGGREQAGQGDARVSLADEREPGG